MPGDAQLEQLVFDPGRHQLRVHLEQERRAAAVGGHRSLAQSAVQDVVPEVLRAQSQLDLAARAPRHRRTRLRTPSRSPRGRGGTFRCAGGASQKVRRIQAPPPLVPSAWTSPGWSPRRREPGDNGRGGRRSGSRRAPESWRQDSASQARERTLFLPGALRDEMGGTVTRVRRRRNRRQNGLHMSFQRLRLQIPLGNTFC